MENNAEIPIPANERESPRMFLPDASHKDTSMLYSTRDKNSVIQTEHPLVVGQIWVTNALDDVQGREEIASPRIIMILDTDQNDRSHVMVLPLSIEIQYAANFDFIVMKGKENILPYSFIVETWNSALLRRERLLRCLGSLAPNIVKKVLILHHLYDENKGSKVFKTYTIEGFEDAVGFPIHAENDVRHAFQKHDHLACGYFTIPFHQSKALLREASSEAVYTQETNSNQNRQPVEAIASSSPIAARDIESTSAAYQPSLAHQRSDSTFSFRQNWFLAHLPVDNLLSFLWYLYSSSLKAMMQQLYKHISVVNRVKYAYECVKSKQTLHILLDRLLHMPERSVRVQQRSTPLQKLNTKDGEYYRWYARMADLTELTHFSRDPFLFDNNHTTMQRSNVQSRSFLMSTMTSPKNVFLRFLANRNDFCLDLRALLQLSGYTVFSQCESSSGKNRTGDIRIQTKTVVFMLDIKGAENPVICSSTRMFSEEDFTSTIQDTELSSFSCIHPDKDCAKDVISQILWQLESGAIS